MRSDSDPDDLSGDVPGDGAAGWSPPRGLPQELTTFFGRTEELAALDDLLGPARLVTVTGPGGVGKSRLALRAAARAAERFCGQVGLVDLAGVRDPSLVEYVLAEAAGVKDQTARAPGDALVSLLAEERLLLVVDGYEQVRESCALLLDTLLRCAPGLVVLAAGRRPLEVVGERVLPLAPLPPQEAVALFTDRASALVPGFTAAGEEGARVGELCRRLDGLPLAVELAAGRLRALSPAQVLERLDEGLGLLTGNATGMQDRHRALRTTIGFSHELCGPGERLLWARLSVFAGAFELDAAEYVCGGHGLPAESVLETLEALLAQSVVIRESTPEGVRFRLLDTVRRYGADWLTAIGDTRRMRRRHRDWFTGLATWCELDWFSGRQTEVAGRVEGALPDLRAALAYCLEEPGEERLGQYLAGSLWFYWVGCGRLAEGRHWLERSVSLPEGHPEARLKCLWVLGHVAALQGDTTGALGRLTECRQAAELLGSEPALAAVEHRLGCVALVTDDLETAERRLRAARERYRGLGELNSNVLLGQVELAMSLVFQGELAEAVELCEEVRTLCEEYGERWTFAYAQWLLGYAAWVRGDTAGARELLRHALRVNETFGDLLGAVLAVEVLALVAVTEGDAAEAAVLQGAATRMWRSVGLQLFGSAHYGEPRRLCAARARAELGERGYADGHRAGERLDFTAAVARALRGPAVPMPGPRGDEGGAGTAAGEGEAAREDDTGPSTAADTTDSGDEGGPGPHRRTRSHPFG